MSLRSLWLSFLPWVMVSLLVSNYAVSLVKCSSTPSSATASRPFFKFGFNIIDLFSQIRINLNCPLLLLFTSNLIYKQPLALCTSPSTLSITFHRSCSSLPTAINCFTINFLSLLLK